MKKSLFTKIVGTVLGAVLIILSIAYLGYLMMSSDSTSVTYSMILLSVFKVLGKIIMVCGPIVAGIFVFKYIYD